MRDEGRGRPGLPSPVSSRRHKLFFFSQMSGSPPPLSAITSLLLLLLRSTPSPSPSAQTPSPPPPPLVRLRLLLIRSNPSPLRLLRQSDLPLPPLHLASSPLCSSPSAVRNPSPLRLRRPEPPFASSALSSSSTVRILRLLLLCWTPPRSISSLRPEPPPSPPLACSPLRLLFLRDLLPPLGPVGSTVDPSGWTGNPLTRVGFKAAPKLLAKHSHRLGFYQKQVGFWAHRRTVSCGPVDLLARLRSSSFVLQAESHAFWTKWAACLGLWEMALDVSLSI